MKTIKPMRLHGRASAPRSTAALYALVAAALLTACGREENPKLKIEPTAAETTPPPAPQSQYDMTPPAAPQPASTGVVQSPTGPQIVTNMPPPLLMASSNAVPGTAKEYTVVKGDTLLKIARANGVRFTALSNANHNVNLSKLVVGQKIRIPTAPSASSAGIGFREPGNGVDAASGNVHVVKAGETLTRIAKENHTTVKAIQAANGLKTARVLVGQRLRLPAASQPTVPPPAGSNSPGQIQASSVPPK